MSRTPSKTARLNSANGAARRMVAKQLVDLPIVHRRHRHHLLGDDVERVARVAGRFDHPLVHRARDRRRRDQIAAELREDDALR
jgi:hypothetical protein